MDLQKNNKILFKDTPAIDDFSDDSSISSKDEGDLRGKQFVTNVPVSTPIIGNGLKRPLEVGADGNPIIKKRQRPQRRKPRAETLNESPWDGFDSDVNSRSSPSRTESIGTQTDTECSSDAMSTDSSMRGHQDSQSSSSEDVDEEFVANRKQRSSAFMAWATQQVNEALGFSPSAIEAPESAKKMSNHEVKPREPEQDALPPELETKSNFPERQVFSVQVNRSPEVQESRLGLPIVAEEQKIMEAIYNNPSVVIWGSTGSGKTTQVPQFLYEAGFGDPDSPNPGMIGVTQPRRVAAVSMARRVSDELGDVTAKVSYQIRFDSTVSHKTAIKFMTDGILIREIAKDFALTKYSAIVIDEAHERTANTDILIGMVSRIVDLRASMSQEDAKVRPLKLIIMSATLRVSDFTDNPNLFRNGPPPLLQAEGRQYPVSIHFARRTQRDYLEETFLKVSRGHKKLPPGGMLVFLTGQNEITVLAKRLKEAFTNTQGKHHDGHRVRVAANEVPLETEDFDLGIDNLGSHQAGDDDDEDIHLYEDEDEEDKEFDIGDATPGSLNIRVLPLYSQLPTKDQLLVFSPTPENTRLIVLATNVAETSLTIPGIRYVFDCGRAKAKKYDRTNGVQTFEIGWISKASASQRAGRAGRTAPGHCYRLYSSAVYERDFEEHAEPEILRMPVEGVVLQLKSMDLQHVVNFPFPTPPDRHSLAKAEKLLTHLGAISREGKITPLGRELSMYPLSPRFSKMLLIGHQHNCMPYTIAMVAALSVPSIFLTENQLDLSSDASDITFTDLKKAYNSAHHLFSLNSPTSDALKHLTALCAHAHASNPEAFAASKFLHPKSLHEAHQLRAQLTTLVRTNNPTHHPESYSHRLSPPTPTQLTALPQILAAAYIDQIAIRADLSPNPPEQLQKPRTATQVPYLPLFPSHSHPKNPEKEIYIHPSSLLAHSPPATLPQYLLYSHLSRASTPTITTSHPKTRMHPLAAISAKQIAALAHGTPLLEWGKPVGEVEEVEGGKRECFVGAFLRGEKGGQGWGLGLRRVVMGSGVGGSWVVERVVG